jgi:DNA-binding CsgD family transcriptional regulator
MAPDGVEELRGRRSEREVLNRLLAAVRGGQSGVLVVCGDPGVGKTALVESVVGPASECQVARAAGVESEMELAFAALQQLCAPMLDRLDRLPPPQQDALAVAFGLRAGDVPDRFLVGLAVLSLFSESAQEQPLVCVVDDAQWLDRASMQALAFVARRLLAESIALVLMTRNPGDELRGLPHLVLEGLHNGDARALLGSALRVPLDERVQERIVAETHGNPLALLELPRGLSPTQLAGGFGLPASLPLSGRIEDSFQRRFGALPEETQRLLLVAAAEPVGDPVLVWQAAGRLGIGIEAATETDGLLTIGARVTFRHPLVRSAIYRMASPVERQAVHRALADATDPQVDPDRRAWHRAQAAFAPDEEVAAELERSAGRAQARGGLAAAAAFHERASELTPDPGGRARRALAAAHANQLAGAPEAALRLLAAAEAGPLEELERAQADLLRGHVAFASSHSSDAPPLLLAAARRFEPLDASLARATYLDALSAAMYGGRLESGAEVADIVAAVRAAPPPPQPPRAPDLLLDGLALVIADGHAAGTPTVNRALARFRAGDVTREEELRWLWLACRSVMEVWDDEMWDVLSARHVQLAREAGALAVLPVALSSRIAVDVFTGDLAAAASLVDEVHGLSEATGNRLEFYVGLALAAWQGRDQPAVELIEPSMRGVVRRGEGMGVWVIQWAGAVLYNGLSRYHDALAAARRAGERPHEAAWALPELVEAAARSGEIALASEALGRLTAVTQASGTDWALGAEAVSRALLSEGEAAERLYREAIERLGRTRIRGALARAHLLYGEWLRRERRRLDAREQLRTAHERFSQFGMDAFAQRARVELKATGEYARKRTVQTRDELTPQEAQISRLAVEGATNQEIAAQLFISSSTVDYHLRKAFRKLGVKSRHELEQHM